MLKWLLRKYRGLLVLIKIRSAWAGDTKKIFTHHYAENYWGNAESRSGFGSTAEYTANVRAELPGLIEELKITTMLDAPCGDYNWFKLVRRTDNVNYIGGDIVDPMISANQAKYGNGNTRFGVIDIIHGELPKADLWLCRDCLFHFSNNDIMSTLQNLLRSDIRYLLTSTHPECTANTDIATGSFRLLNLELAPFNFPKAMLYIDDYVKGFPVRKLGLWDRHEVEKVLQTR